MAFAASCSVQPTDLTAEARYVDERKHIEMELHRTQQGSIKTNTITGFPDELNLYIINKCIMNSYVYFADLRETQCLCTF